MKRAFYKPRLVTGIIFSLLFFCPPAIYAFEPVPGSLTPEERARVIGVEAPVWTEDIRMDRLDRKVFPRLISIAEVVWTDEKRKNWESFQHRFAKHAQIIEALNIAYDRSDFIIEAK
tara:strand:- start:36 stop:386 length:351 start_codon:yes stop_codon:yes gene_type:complete